MSLADSPAFTRPCSGNITEFGGVSEVIDQIEGFLRETLPKVAPEISSSRFESKKRRNERSLASELSKRLNFAAHSEVFHFESEDPENDSATRTLDYGTYPSTEIRIGSRILGAIDRLYGIEAKRLPTHTGETDQADREREYVVGDWKMRSSPNKRLKGGIERFKEGLHGADLKRAGMIAFIQKEDTQFWFDSVNAWIADLIDNPLESHKSKWAVKDQLIKVHSSHQSVSEFQSQHARSRFMDLLLTHFWLILGDQEPQN